VQIDIPPLPFGNGARHIFRKLQIAMDEGLRIAESCFARRIMFEKFAAGTGGNQRDIVAAAKLPIAVVNGRDEPFVELDFVSNVRFGNLWEGKTHVIDNAGHAPFREMPAVFDAYLARFITDCTA